MRRPKLALALLLLAACDGDGDDGGGGGGAIDAAAGGADAAGAGSDAGATVDAGPGGADAMPWAGPGADPADWQPRTIYLVIPDRFANGNPGNDAAGHAGCLDPAVATKFHGGDLAGLAARAGYLKELGIGTLWVTPLAKQVPLRNDACGYHGYWADLTRPAEAVDDSVEPYLGTPAELDALLAGLHAAGLRVILDIVVNHPGRNARIVAQEPGWFHPIPGCAELGNAEHYCSLNGLPDFAQERAEVAAYVTATTVAWLDRFAFDGVRMDTAKHVPMAYFADSWLPAARAARPYPFVVAEVFSDGDMAPFGKYLDAGFDSFFHFPLRRALVNAVAKGGSLDELAGVVADTIGDLGIARARKITTFLDNHDVPRFMQEGGDLPDDERVRRYRLALVALFTLPGIPQLYYGDELGMLGVYPDNRRDVPLWAFDPATRAGARPGYFGDPAQTFALVRDLILLRKTHPALWNGTYAEVWRPNGGKNVFAYHRASTGAQAGDRVLVIIGGGTGASGELSMRFADNPGIAAADRAAWPDGTVLTDVLGHGAPATLTIAGGRILVNMPARTAGIYRVVP